MTGHKPRELDIQPMPDGMSYLVGLFWELKRTADPLTWQELDAWMRVMDRPVDPEEARVLMRMDSIYGRVMAEG